ncbi:MAG: hypothetical protein ACFFDL_11850 [Promethearchaeota archaeon]
MKDNKISTYALAKNISYEIIIEEKLQLKSEATSRLLEKYNKKRTSLKVRFLSYKIINAIIFGILPIFPLMAYLDISRFLVDVPVHHQISIFIKSLTFEIFFTLQFLDFFLMGVFNLINIMSGEIFEWFKTLPLPRKKLKRLAFITIFHNFDLPILANTFVFPIIMLFVTQNIIVFFITLGTSILNSIFSISVLIILGEKIAKLIRRQNIKAKKSLLIQVLNTFSYAIIIFGSIFIIQMILNSLVTILIASLNLYRSPFYNAILGLIPFPFNPSYLISIFTTTSQIEMPYLLNPIFGLGLYLILIYFVLHKALKSLNNIISLKYKINKRDFSDKKDGPKIHTTSKIKAFIRKDLLIASRNIQTFMSFIMPIVMSFVFMIFFNISYAGGGDLLSRDLYYNWIILLGFSLVISGITVYNLLNMETTGRTIIGALPIVYRDHAKAKLIIIILIQIIATLAPVLVYVLHFRFIELLLTVLATLPFVLIFLILTFLLRVRLFGKRKYSYVLEEILPENKTSKWILIFGFEYFLYYLILVISNFLYFSNNFIGLFLILFIIAAIFTAIVISIFNKFFPKFRKKESLVKKPKSKFVKKFLFIILSYIIYFIAFSISNLIYNFFELSLLLGGLFILTGVILILEVIKSPKKKYKKKSQQRFKKEISTEILNLEGSRHLLITSIRVIYVISSIFFILVYGFFLGGLLILTGIIIILELIISSLNKKKSIQNNSKIKNPPKKKVDIVRYIVNSFLKHVLILFGVLFLNFILLRSLPGEPLSSYLPARPVAEEYWSLYYELGFHLPLWQQFFLYLGRLFTGNWGNAIKYSGIPVKELILERISNYFIILIIPISILLFFKIRTSFKETNKKRIYRKLIRVILLLFFSIPSFLLVLFIYLLSNEITIEVFTQLIIMTSILSISLISKLTFMKRRDMLNNYDPSSYAIKKKKSFLNSSGFLITSILISEMILIEAVLNLQGLGPLFVEAICVRDIFLIEGILFIFTLTIVSVSFLQSLLKLYFHIKNIKNSEFNKLLKTKSTLKGIPIH